MKSMIQKFGLLGVVSLLSYTAAVIFAPFTYPGYNWMAQAVSDLSANNAPSKMLWEQLSSLYGVCGMISIMMVCVFIQGKLNKPLRIGIYLFAIMNWVSNVGYAMFPLSDSGNVGAFQDIMDNTKEQLAKNCGKKFTQNVWQQELSSRPKLVRTGRIC